VIELVRTSNVPFFRRSYILGGYAWSKNQRKEVVVHALYYCFWHESTGVDAWMEGKVEDLWHDETIKMGNPTITKSGWELVEVMSDEAKGLGFYRLVFLVNDRPVRKVDIRLGRKFTR